MSKKILLQALGLFIFICLILAYNYYLDYLTKLQQVTFEIYTIQVIIASMLTITTGTVCLFLYQILEKVKRKDKSFNYKILLLYAIPALFILFSREIYFSNVGIALGPLVSKMFRLLFHTRTMGAVLLGLGIVHALFLIENKKSE